MAVIETVWLRVIMAKASVPPLNFFSNRHLVGRLTESDN
jgi:hypothetical protein